MRARWNILAAALVAAFTITAATSANAAEIAFSSQSDFTEINLNIRDTYNGNPDLVELEVTLSQDAQQRMQLATTAALEQDLTLLIDGKAVGTSRVQSVVDAPQLRISMPKHVAVELLPSLLNVNAVPGRPVTPVAAPATSSASASIAGPLLAAAPIVAQAQQVVPPTVAESVPESVPETALMPEPAAQMPDEPAAPAPATPQLAAAPAVADVADPPSPQPQESAMAPEAADPPAPPTPPPPPPPPVMPDWVLGAWLPTSATPSQYAEINVGDPVTVFAHGIDAITCNKARLAVLESSAERVQLQLAPNSQCVIAGVQVDRMQISPSVMPGKIVISFYAQQDDINGAPAKQATYRRK